MANKKQSRFSKDKRSAKKPPPTAKTEEEKAQAAEDAKFGPKRGDAKQGPGGSQTGDGGGAPGTPRRTAPGG